MPNAETDLKTETVAQVSKPAVSPISKSAVRATACGCAGLETRDTADLEVCATEAETPPLPVAQVSKPAVSPISKSAVRAMSCACAGLVAHDTADLEVCATEAETPPLLVAQVSQPAVSPVSNWQASASSESGGTVERSADCKSAIQQVKNLRYDATRSADAYRFLSELLLYPADRDVQNLESHAERAGNAVPELREAIASMMANPELDDCDTYLESFEISAKCPLYLGHYQFEEPKSCSGAAVSGRNAYMIQLKNLYRHFGFEVHGRELPDYLPLMLDFLALSATHPAHKHRRLLIKQFMLPALPGLCKALREAGKAYAPVAGMLELLLHLELQTTSASPTATEGAGGELSESADARPRSADFQSAVSPISNRQGAGQDGDARNAAPLAGWKPAIQCSAAQS